VLLDGRLVPETVDEALVEQVQRLAPFGHHNEEPAFLLEQAQLAATPDVLKGRHLKWRLHPSLEMVAWNRAEGYAPDPALWYRVRLGLNEFRGRRSVQLTVDDMQPRTAVAAP
jgi:single-stranded-DNA-specific exonuclease